jgi:hypothetical protein
MAVAAAAMAVPCATRAPAAARMVACPSIGTTSSTATGRTAQQLFEKYLQLGRDATSSGDRVMGEGYFQHAEHYFRIVSAINQAAAQHQQQVAHQNGNQRRNGEEISPSEESDFSQDRDSHDEGRGNLVEAREIPITAAAPDA